MHLQIKIPLYSLVNMPAHLTCGTHIYADHITSGVYHFSCQRSKLALSTVFVSSSTFQYLLNTMGSTFSYSKFQLTSLMLDN
jgi:hypothetical protein